MEPNFAHNTQAEDAQPTALDAEALAMQEAAAAVAEALKQQDAPDAPEARVAELEAEVASLKDAMLRAVAETENLRRRTAREMDDARKYAVTGFARDLTGAIENMYRAIGSISPEARAQNEAMENLAQGLDMTLRDLQSSLERHGVKRLWPEGQMFDHHQHQAVAQIDSAEHPAGTILQVLQAGYIIHDRLLQPAMVCVARAASGHVVDTQA